MASLNQCNFIGRLGADPESRRTSDGRPVVSLRLAVSDTWRDKQTGERKERTEWVSVVIWQEGLCRVAEQYLSKGSLVYVSGQFQTRKWKDQQGNDRYSTEIVLNGFGSVLQMLDGGKKAEPKADDHSENYGGGGSVGMDDEIPFMPEWR